MGNFFEEHKKSDVEGDEGKNLFNSENLIEKKEDNSLDAQYRKIENNYEQIFIEAAESIRRDLNEFKPKDACSGCVIKDCKVEEKDIFSLYPQGCKYRDWQVQALAYLSGDYKQKLKAAYKSIMDKKEEYECNKCGACCKLAVSEYSYEQLKQRALKGDKFSADFVSVFIPYENEEDAKAINPEYFALLNRLVEEDKIYYYHCPKVKDNMCSIYEERPDICKDFPHNPLKLLPSECSYSEWRNEVSHAAMLLKAKVDITAFYKDKLG